MVRGIFDRELWGVMGDEAVALAGCCSFLPSRARPELLAISLNDFLSLPATSNKVICAFGF